MICRSRSSRIGEASVRASVRAAHVRALAEVPDSWPPILVDRQSHEIIDGVHRYHAAASIGKPTISCALFDGSAHEALLEAIHRNVQHGLPLSLKERQTAARRVLTRYEGWSDRKIARLCGLSPSTVGGLRDRSSVKNEQSNGRQGIDGRVRPTDAGGLRQRIEQAVQSSPGASLREIASLVGASPSTVKSVRDRVRNGNGLSVVEGEKSLEKAITAQFVHPQNGNGHRVTVPMNGLPRSDGNLLLGSPPSRRHESNWGSDTAISATADGAVFSVWFSRTLIEEDWYEHVDSVPLSRSYEIADEARRRARCWNTFADLVERRTRGGRG